MIKRTIMTGAHYAVLDVQRLVANPKIRTEVYHLDGLIWGLRAEGPYKAVVRARAVANNEILRMCEEAAGSDASPA